MLSSKSINVKKTFFLLVIIVCLGGICFGVFSLWNFFDNSENEKEGIIKTYNKNKGIINHIANYATNLDGNIYINQEGDRNYSIQNSINGKTAELEINDNVVKSDIETVIKDLGFKRISELGNSVYFQKKAFLQFDTGVVYSKDGNKPDWANLTILERIEGNWYYYRSK